MCVWLSRGGVLCQRRSAERLLGEDQSVKWSSCPPDGFLIVLIQQVNVLGSALLVPPHKPALPRCLPPFTLFEPRSAYLTSPRPLGLPAPVSLCHRGIQKLMRLGWHLSSHLFPGVRWACVFILRENLKDLQVNFIKCIQINININQMGNLLD